MLVMLLFTNDCQATFPRKLLNAQSRAGKQSKAKAAEEQSMFLPPGMTFALGPPGVKHAPVVMAPMDGGYGGGGYGGGGYYPQDPIIKRQTLMRWMQAGKK